MPIRHLPVRPNLVQLRNQAKDLLGDFRAGDPQARDLFEELHSEGFLPEQAALADAQLVIARSHGVRSWPRLKRACKVIQAIWEDRPEDLKRLILTHPHLLHEEARGVPNWVVTETKAWHSMERP